MDADGSGPILIGVSACLLGQRVRYDGNHKLDDFVAGVLAEHVSFVPVCPELEIGLGVPRETLRLARRGTDVRLIGNDTATDYTPAMRRYARAKVRQLRARSRIPIRPSPLTRRSGMPIPLSSTSRRSSPGSNSSLTSASVVFA